MGVITYTAKRSIANGHEAGTQYSLEMDLQKIDRSSKTSRTSHVAISGITETYFARIDKYFSLQTDMLNTQEQPRTNLLHYSQDFSDASWNKTSVTLTANAATAPDGTNTADKFSINGVTALDCYQSRDVGVLSARQFMFSMWLWTDAGQPTNIWSLEVTDHTNTFTLPIALTTTPQRFAVASIFAPGNAATSLDVRLKASAGNNAKYCYAWGGQLEESKAVSAYIPSDATAATEPSKLDSVNEFLDSVAGGESFSVDLYGSLWSPRSPIVLSLEDDNWTEARDGTSNFVSIAFKVKQL